MNSNKAKISKVNFGEGIIKFVILLWDNALKKYSLFKNDKETVLFDKEYQAKSFAIGAGFNIEN